MTAKRVAIYTRVSRDEQADNWSLPTQEAECRAYAERMGYEVVGVWTEDFTGTDIDRPEMSKILKLVQSRQVDVVLSYKVDRLTRGGNFALGWFLTEFTRHGAVGEFVVEPLDDTPEGQVMAGFRAGSASREVLETRERTNRGLRAKAKSGKPIGRSRAPFGLRYKPPTYDVDGKPIKGTANAAYEPDPTTVEPLRWMFDQADEGTSLRGIARGLDNLGVRPSYADRTGSTKWNPTSVRHILTNRCYVGEGVQFAVRVEKHPDPRFMRRRVTRPIDPDGDGAIPMPPGLLPVVIEPALFERVQRRLEQNKRESQRKDRNPEVGLLRRGIARCGHCNSSLGVIYNGRKDVDGKAATYGCQTIQRERHGCPRCDINIAKLDREVWEWIKVLRDDPRLVAVFADRIRSEDGDGGKDARLLHVIDERIAEVEGQRAKLTKRLGIVDDDTAVLVAEELQRLGEQRKALGLQRDRQSAKAEAEERRALRVERTMEIVAGLGDDTTDLDALGYHEQRRILHDLGAVVHLFPNGHRPRWGMTLAFDNDRGRTRVVGDENLSVVWDEDGDFDEATFYLSSTRARTGTASTARRPAGPRRSWSLSAISSRPGSSSGPS